MTGTAPTAGAGTPDDASSAASEDGGDGFTLIGSEDAGAPVDPHPVEDDAGQGA